MSYSAVLLFHSPLNRLRCSPEQIFSDDESDNESSSEEDEGSGDSGFEDAESNGDDDDSGFEDAVASPGRPPIGRPGAENTVETPEANDGGSGGRDKVLADGRQGLSFERLPHVPSADKAPSVSVPTFRRSEEHLDLTGVQASEEAPDGNPPQQHRQKLAAATTAPSADKAPSVSVTPSHSQDHLDEDDTPAEQQESASRAFNSTFSTPAHSRDRNSSNRPPPLAAAPAGSGGGSRRVHRERHLNSEDLDATSTEDMPSAEEPAPVHASQSPTASLPLKAVNCPYGSVKKKKFSYVSDNTWLKPKEVFPEPAPSPLELGSVGVPGECSPIQRNTHSTPASGSAAASTMGTAGDATALTARRNRHGFPSEAEQQLGQDVLDEVIPEAEARTQGTQRVFSLLPRWRGVLFGVSHKCLGYLSITL